MKAETRKLAEKLLIAYVQSCRPAEDTEELVKSIIDLAETLDKALQD